MSSVGKPSNAAADQAFQRLAKDLVRKSGADRCHGCGRRLISGDRTTIGYDPQRHGLIVADCCRDKIAVAIGGGLYLAATDAPASWLATVPERSRA
jgi:hypothetical protein